MSATPPINAMALVIDQAPVTGKDDPMPARSFITIFDYTQELSRLADFSRAPLAPDEPFPRGCEICQAPLTVSCAYPARFGTVRCRQCISDDGFATGSELEEFRATGIISCRDCGTRTPPAAVSTDRLSYQYQCPACGATAQFTLRVPA